MWCRLQHLGLWGLTPSCCTLHHRPPPPPGGQRRPAAARAGRGRTAAAACERVRSGAAGGERQRRPPGGDPPPPAHLAKSYPPCIFWGPSSGLGGSHLLYLQHERSLGFPRPTKAREAPKKPATSGRIWGACTAPRHCPLCPRHHHHHHRVRPAILPGRHGPLLRPRRAPD